MDINTGLVKVEAHLRPPGRGPKCGVCRQYVPKGAPCISIKGQHAPNSKFYLHIKCASQVLLKLMEAFNYANNGMQVPDPAVFSKDLKWQKEEG